MAEIDAGLNETYLGLYQSKIIFIKHVLDDQLQNVALAGNILNQLTYSNLVTLLDNNLESMFS